jgi:hypothetical protein
LEEAVWETVKVSEQTSGTQLLEIINNIPSGLKEVTESLTVFKKSMAVEKKKYGRK